MGSKKTSKDEDAEEGSRSKLDASKVESTGGGAGEEGEEGGEEGEKKDEKKEDSDTDDDYKEIEIKKKVSDFLMDNPGKKLPEELMNEAVRWRLNQNDC